MKRVDRCGTWWQEFRRLAYGPDGQPRDERVLICLPCGLRVCDHCWRRERERLQYRLSGHWETFITLTFPQAGEDLRETWRKASRCASKLANKLRDHWRRRGPDPSGSGKRLILFKPEYAWVLEEHESGWPHVHLATDAELAKKGEKDKNRRWLMKQWLRIIRPKAARWAHVHVSKVRDSSRARDYLCDYLNKSTFSREVLTVLSGRRVYACTLKLAKRDPEGWEAVKRVDEDVAVDRVERAQAWADLNGWILDWSSPGIGAAWYRPMIWERQEFRPLERGREAWQKMERRLSELRT